MMIKQLIYNAGTRCMLVLSLLASVLVMASCSDEETEIASDGYGYIQISLNKANTRAMVEGNALNYLNEAKKVKLSLRKGSNIIEQTLNLNAASTEAAEFGLTSENLKIQAGEYQLLSYAVYGEYKSGDMAEVLQVCQPDEPTTITIHRNELTRQQLLVEAKKYGRFTAHLVRIEPEVVMAKAAGKPIYGNMYNFNDIDSVQIVFHRNVDGILYREDRKVKAVKGNGDIPVFDTEEVNLQAGNYTLSHFELFNKRKQFMYAQDVEIPFTVEHYTTAKADVEVEQPMTDGIRDGIALKQIWSAMDGKSWNWHEADGNGGANWVFALADGSPRPISAWINQVGVVVINGRVVSLNLGSFNPIGDVPDAIGQLTALEKLYLGMHTDEVYYQLEGTGGISYRLNPWELGQKMDTKLHRMDIARERTTIRRMNQDDFSNRSSEVLYKGKTDPAAKLSTMKYAAKGASTYGQHTSDPANRITGISPEIGKLTNLQELYISNTLIKRLPIEMQNLTNITDLELFNNPFEDVDGEIFKNMKDLTLVNFDSFYRMTEEQIHATINKMCDYCPRIQLFYMNRLGLTNLPDHLNKLTDLRLLDASFNKISKVKSLKPMAPIQFMMNYNKLTELPADFINVADLELFSITDNQLKEFPVVLSNLDGFYTIEEIDLTGNRMHGFQEGFKGVRVEKLKIGFNCMGRASSDNYKSEFPTEFSDTNSEIFYFVISGNNIDNIRNSAVANIKYLQAFDISVNNLKTLPSYFNSEHFPYLTGLDCSHNRFEGFPNNVLNIASMSQLLISDQGYYSDEAETLWVRTMTTWPEYLHQHGSLNNLNMSGNDFRTVVNFPSNLTTLNVQNNPNIKMVVPAWVYNKIQQGLYVLYCDEDQDITVE